MTDLPELTFTAVDIDAIADAEGQVAVFVPETGKLDVMARRVNRLTKGALQRFVDSDAFEDLSDGGSSRLSFPTGMAAEAIHVIRLEKRSRGKTAREAGAVLGSALGEKGALVLVSPGLKGLDDVLLGLSLRAYTFEKHRTGDEKPSLGAVTVMTSDEEAVERASTVNALASGVWFTRDLTNEPSNILTTTEFADRLEALAALGVKVEVLEEDALEKLGMRTCLLYTSPSPRDQRGSRMPSSA